MRKTIDTFIPFARSCSKRKELLLRNNLKAFLNFCDLAQSVIHQYMTGLVFICSLLCRFLNRQSKGLSDSRLALRLRVIIQGQARIKLETANYFSPTSKSMRFC